MKIHLSIDKKEWDYFLNRAVKIDTYQSFEYHMVEQQRLSGTAVLVVFQEDEYFIAFPLILQDLTKIYNSSAFSEYKDANSVYGYSGPFYSHNIFPVSFLSDFVKIAPSAFKDLKIVTIFSRLNPLFDQDNIIKKLGQVMTLGKTVSIDLTLPQEIQTSQVRSNHRRDIAKLKKLGVQTFIDCNKENLDTFIDIYYETMLRVEAHSTYFFDSSYFLNLVKKMNEKVILAFCVLENNLICGGLFFFYKKIIQYHLGGTLSSYLHLAPMKLLFDDIRKWGMLQQASTLHLGGGLGSRNDSLFNFKAGFSSIYHDYKIWKWILFPDIYEKLTKQKLDLLMKTNQQINFEFFPMYRHPINN